MLTTSRPIYRDQAEARTQRLVRDTLSRPWVLEVERATDAPVGPMLPVRADPAWTDTTDSQIPPQKYLRLDDDTLVIYWGWWATDLRKLIDPQKRPMDYGRITHDQLAGWRDTLAYVERYL